MPSLTRAEMKTSFCFILRVGSFISLQEQRSPNPPVFSSALFPSWEDGARVPLKPTDATLPSDTWGSLRTKSQGPAASVAPRIALHFAAVSTSGLGRAEERAGRLQVSAGCLKGGRSHQIYPLCHSTGVPGLSLTQSVETPRDA